MSSANTKLLASLSGEQLDALARLLRRRGAPTTQGELSPLVGAQAAPTMLSALTELFEAGMSAAQVALTCELIAEGVRRDKGQRAELVWTGPEPERSVFRDTELVVQDMMRRAQRSILLSSYNLDERDRVFQETFGLLIERLRGSEQLEAIIVLNIQHDQRQRRRSETASVVVQEFSQRLEARWGGGRRASIYYDPRALELEEKTRPVHHSKCLVLDEEEAFITSANFTQAAHKRNIEAGVLLRDAHIARQLHAQFTGLIEREQLMRLPRW